MRHRFLLVLTSFIISAALLTGCRKSSDNGHLDGQWQLMTVEMPDGTVSRPSRTYYRFILHTGSLYSADTGDLVTGSMEYSGTRLVLTFPYISDPSRLMRWGISVNPAEYTIVTLTRSSLVMTTGAGAVLTLRKF